jgi:hypothetical protein
MSARFTQVSRGRWPHGIDKPIAILRAEPAELARRFSVRFSHGMDELDEFEQAGLKLKSGRSILLTRYRRSPGPGTTISVDCGDDATEALRDVRRALELSARELSWVAEDVEEEPRRSIFAACAETVRSWVAGRAARKAAAIQGAVHRPL